jgi:IMP dehydrogenase
LLKIKRRKTVKIKKALCFDDVLLKPRFSDIRSRSQVDLSVRLNDKITLRLPFIASPMDTVSGVQTAIELGKLGGLAIIHRYNTIDEQVSMVEEVVSHGVPVGAAIGATGDFKERADALIAAGAGVVCVDIANGYHVLIKEAMDHLKAKHKDVYWMTGNVSCFGGFLYNSHAGSDCVRVGIGGGSCCTTRIKTGCGVPTFSSVLDASKVKNQTESHIIADGGLKTSGDIVKALAAGADLVMLGSLFAGTDEAPGEVLEVDGRKMKEFRGMASKDAQMDWRGSAAGGVEGVSTLTPYKGPLKDIVESLAQGVRSGLSYVGARTIEELQDNPEFIEISSGGLAESKPHALK